MRSFKKVALLAIGTLFVIVGLFSLSYQQIVLDWAFPIVQQYISGDHHLDPRGERSLSRTIEFTAVFSLFLAAFFYACIKESFRHVFV